MSIKEMKSLVIGNLKAKIPIVQGGMGVGISLSGLASAVANEGGIGVISSACVGMFENDLHANYREANIRALKSEIRKAREKTDGILGVNIMKALTNFKDMVKTSIKEGIDIIFAGAGLPLNLPQYVDEAAETKLIPIISSGRAAAIIAKKWIKKFNYIPDAFVVEGPKAGGHLGFKPEQINDKRFTLDKLIIQVKEALKTIEDRMGKKIPLIAAGGIYTGRDIREMMDLGASGVQMATRFVTTEECDADQAFKNAYIQCKKEDLRIIESPVGMPGRVIQNQFVQKVLEGEKKPFSCPYHCIKTCEKEDSPYCIALSLINARQGQMSQGFAFAGENAYRAEEIISVSKLINDIKEEY
ncbi:MAG: NAD(P)H-dependent flavin oxidoreductase, partial [Halanaerobiales bacterium]